MNWNEQQSAALKAVEAWYKDKKRKQIFRVFGYAGTGKTTLAKHFASSIDGLVLYAAFTGKAALMMAKNGCTGASTIHSLIYKAEECEKTGEPVFVLNQKSMLKEAKLLIVDECSMVDESLARDILRFKKPVLVLGDPAQLPPVAGAGYFTNAEPDAMLTEIHRQAKDNPIIYLATEVRNGNYPKLGTYGDSIVTSKIKTTDLLEHEQVIVGRNATRDMVNRKVRKLMKLDETELPVEGDRLICLKNSREHGIYNGEMFNVLRTFKNHKSPLYPNYKLEDTDSKGKVLTVKIHNSFFDGTTKPDWKLLAGTQEFDFGYGITTHKAQGSQWDSTLIFDEAWCFRDDAARWLYTAITRAQTRLTIYQ